MTHSPTPSSGADERLAGELVESNPHPVVPGADSCCNDPRFGRRLLLGDRVEGSRLHLVQQLAEILLMARRQERRWPRNVVQAALYQLHVLHALIIFVGAPMNVGALHFSMSVSILSGPRR